MSEPEKDQAAAHQYPSARSASTPEDRAQVKKVIAQRGLIGLANDTKWDEFLAVMRPWAEGKQVWRYSWRTKYVNGYVCPWDCDWFYHLPFPLVGVEWMDVSFLQETREHRIPPKIHITDHSSRLVAAIQKIGLDFTKGETMVRIFGYGPKDFSLFDVE